MFFTEISFAAKNEFCYRDSVPIETYIYKSARKHMLRLPLKRVPSFS